MLWHSGWLLLLDFLFRAALAMMYRWLGSTTDQDSCRSQNSGQMSALMVSVAMQRPDMVDTILNLGANVEERYTALATVACLWLAYSKTKTPSQAHIPLVLAVAETMIDCLGCALLCAALS